MPLSKKEIAALIARKTLQTKSGGFPNVSELHKKSHDNRTLAYDSDYRADTEDKNLIDHIHTDDDNQTLIDDLSSINTVDGLDTYDFQTYLDPTLGETNFTSLVHHNNGGVSIIDASISSIKKPDRFAQTLINIECQKGSIDLDYNYKIILHKNDKKLIFYANPKKYNWISKPWDQIQESVVNTHKHFIKCLLNKKIPDTSGKDNLRSLEMVFASYESNKRNKIIKLEL